MTPSLPQLRALVETPYRAPNLRGLEGLGAWDLRGRRMRATLTIDRGRFTVTADSRVVGQATLERDDRVRLSPHLFAWALEVGGVDAARELHAELVRRGARAAARVVARAERWHRELPAPGARTSWSTSEILA